MKFDKTKAKESFDSFLEKRVVPLDKKIKWLICIAAIAIPIAAFFFPFYSPKSKEIRKLEKKRIELQQDIRIAEARAAELDKHKKEKEDTEFKYKQASILLPQQQEIPSLLTNISSLGTNSGLDFVTFQPGSEEPKEFYAEIPVNISVRGPYHNLGYFLYQVSKLNRIVSVSNINLSGPTMERGEMLLSARFRLVTYRFIEVQNTDATPVKK